MPLDAPFTADKVARGDRGLSAGDRDRRRPLRRHGETLGAPTLVADDFFRRRLRARQPGGAIRGPDLLSVIGRALINGHEVGQGSGAGVLGHPHHALAWLANHLFSDGNALRAGEFVLTGSLVKTVWLNAGDQVMMELSGLGAWARRSLEARQRMAPPPQRHCEPTGRAKMRAR